MTMVTVNPTFSTDVLSSLQSQNSFAMEESGVPIPKSRRRFNSMTPYVNGTSPLSPTIVRGFAYLCFSEDGNWFEGHLNTDDQSQYGLVGRRQQNLAATAAAPVDCVVVTAANDTPSETGEMSSDSGVETCRQNNLTSISCNFFDVTVIDHDDEETYTFANVATTESAALRTLLSPMMTFTAQGPAYKGQKADMLIQRFLTPRLVGQNLSVFGGQMTVDLSRSSRSHSLTGSPLWCI